MSKSKIILGIESSCDDTCAAIVKSDKTILSNIISSQIKEHKKYQGIVPEIASRAHLDNITHTVDSAIKDSKIRIEDINAIAVTIGPGLIGGLIVGSVFAKSLAASLNIPCYLINHHEGHLLSARLATKINFPYLALLTSGGHSFYAVCINPTSYKIIGETLDDAAGEAFDKVAKMLNLGFPGGPIIEKLASTGNPYKYKLPLPLHNQKFANLSFSGLKTAVRKIINSNEINSQFINDIAASFQQTMSKSLYNKTKIAINYYKRNFQNNHFAFVGGVAANSSIREKLKELASEENMEIFIPPKNICTDNASMIAWAAHEKIFLGPKYIKRNISPRPTWNIEEI